jgi:hypothetical protein
MRKVNGLPFTIKYMKAVKLHITRYMCGKPLLTNSSFVSTKDGFPTKFYYLKELIDSGSIKDKRLVLSLLSYTRAIIPSNKELNGLKPNFESITDNYTGKVYTIPDKFIIDFVKKFNLKSYLSPYDKDLHYISSKVSPFGPSSLTSPFALYYMIQNASSLLDKFKAILGNSYNNLIGDFIPLI